MLLLPHSAAAASNVNFLFFSVLRNMSFVFMGWEPVFRGAFCCDVSLFFLFFLLPVVSPSGGHTTLLRTSTHLASGPGYFVFLSGLGYVAGDSVPLSYFHFFSVSMYLRWVDGVRILCSSYPVRRHGIALSTTVRAPVSFWGQLTLKLELI